MTDEVFTDTGAARDQWVDVRMTDPDAGEWDVDVVVADGRVEYVDLRIDPDHFRGFLECLVDDLGEQRATEMLSRLAERKGLDLDAARGAGPAED